MTTISHATRSVRDDLRAPLAAIDRLFANAAAGPTHLSAHEVVSYFHQSLPLYLLVHSRRGALHFAIDGDFSAHARIIADHVRPIDAREVLEIASGMGYNASRLARLLPEAHITGVDLTPNHVRVSRMRARLRSNLRFERGDFHDLRFAPGSFDAICAVEGFCHARDFRVALGEIARVLRPGGRFVLVDHFLRRPLTALTPDERRAVQLIDSNLGASRTWTYDELVGRAAALGLHVVSTTDLSARVLGDIDRIGRRAQYWFDRPRRAAALARVLPPKLVRNSIAALLLPAAGRSGAYVYNAVVLERAD